jgi:predicted tellurium resistance membrane protein TerC
MQASLLFGHYLGKMIDASILPPFVLMSACGLCGILMIALVSKVISQYAPKFQRPVQIVLILIFWQAFNFVANGLTHSANEAIFTMSTDVGFTMARVSLAGWIVQLTLIVASTLASIVVLEKKLGAKEG